MANTSGSKVRYGRGVWAMEAPRHDMGEMPSGYEAMQRSEMIGAVLAPAMWRAKQAGELDGCTCGPEYGNVSTSALERDQAGPVNVHRVATAGRLVVVGHGGTTKGTNAIDARHVCPLADPEGEEWAAALVRRGGADALRELWDGTEPFPEAPRGLTPAEREVEPQTWQGDALDVRVNGRSVRVPERHYPDSVREAAARYGALVEDVAKRRTAARQAEDAAKAAPQEAAQAVRAAALSGGKAPDVSALIDQRRREAEVALAQADGYAAALQTRGVELGQAIRAAADTWTPYLLEHATHLLGKAERQADELRATLDELVDVDSARASLAAGSFSSSVHPSVPASVQEAIRSSVRLLADVLAPLELEARRLSRAATKQAGEPVQGDTVADAA